MPSKLEKTMSLARKFGVSDVPTERDATVMGILLRRLEDAGTLGDLPLQKKLTARAFKETIRVLDTWEANCICMTPEQFKELETVAKEAGAQAKFPRNLCPACQRARFALRVWVQIEKLSVERATIQERYVATFVKQQELAAKRAGGDDDREAFNVIGAVNAGREVLAV
ncbi:MAG: hypothetical protein V3V71_09110 [Roseateles sp.]